MKKLVYLLAVLLSSACSIQAQNTGMGYYAILHPDWPCRLSLQALAGVDKIRVSYLANTFGNDRSCLNRILADPRPKDIEIQLVNQVCVRNGRCGSYEALAGESIGSIKQKLAKGDVKLLKKISKAAHDEALAIAPFLNNISQLYVSTFLEHDIGPAIQLAHEAIRQEFPTAKIVDNPLKSDRKNLGADIFEQHGENPRIAGPTIINLDGTDAFSIPLKKYVKKYENSAIINYLWIYEFNGNCRNGGVFVDPRKRKCWPTKEQFNRLKSFL